MAALCCFRNRKMEAPNGDSTAFPLPNAVEKSIELSLRKAVQQDFVLPLASLNSPMADYICLELASCVYPPCPNFPYPTPSVAYSIWN
jgi:hypothetical protein